ncbi:MAG: alkane 1-monooxygenase, partial [Boseongicola sp.]|nr:alkane 1-monooxygenase [Boseongicola sp.]
MTQTPTPRLPSALPFWVSFTLVPIAWISAVFGGWTLFVLPLYAWFAFSVLDHVVGLDTTNPDIDAPNSQIYWHQLVTKVWPFVQFATTFSLLGFVSVTEHLTSVEKVGLFIGVGLMNGTIGLVYAHELIHRNSAFERFLGDLQLGMVLYGHYRSEHLLVHHRYVGTPRDPVTARFRENFWRFYPRVLKESLLSSFRAESHRLGQLGKPKWHRSNPFWRYFALAAVFLLLASTIGGLSGLALYLTSAGFAIFQLELVKYIEHYGL